MAAGHVSENTLLFQKKSSLYQPVLSSGLDLFPIVPHSTLIAKCSKAATINKALTFYIYQSLSQVKDIIHVKCLEVRVFIQVFTLHGVCIFILIIWTRVFHETILESMHATTSSRNRVEFVFRIEQRRHDSVPQFFVLLMPNICIKSLLFNLNHVYLLSI